MIKLLLNSFLLLFTISAFSQINSIEWAGVYSDQNAGLNRIQNLTTDSQGNIYTTLNYAGTTDVDIQASTLTLTSSGPQDAAIVKHNPDGSIAWANSYGSTEGYCQFNKIYIDNNDDIYALGTMCCGTIDFDLSANESIIVGDISSSTNIIVKVDGNGNLIFIKHLQQNPFGTIMDLVFAEDGYIYGAGSFQGTVDFDLTDAVSTLISQPIGATNAVLCKWDTDFSLVWSKQFTTNVGILSNMSVSALEIDSNGNFFISGTFAETYDFDPGAGEFLMTPNTFTQNADYYILKLNSTGDFVWAKQMGLGMGEMNITIDLDQQDNLYITADYLYGYDVDPSDGVFLLESSTSLYGIFVTKWTNNADFVWAKSFLSTLGMYYNITEIVDNNSLWICGKFQGLLDFNPAPDETNAIDSPQNSAYIFQIDLDGNYLSANAFPSTINANILDFEVIAQDELLIAGYHYGIMDINPGAEVTNFDSGDTEDSFIAKCIFTLPDNIVDQQKQDLNIYPNPFHTELRIDASNHPNSILEIYNSEGKKVHHSSVLTSQINLDLSGFSDGIYTIRMIGENGTAIRRVIKE